MGKKDKAAALDTLATETALLYFRMRVAAEELMGDGGHSAGRRSLLRGLARHGPKTVAQMARERPVARQHFQRLVNALKGDGLVELVDNPAHKRSPLVGLTQSGEAFVKAMEAREAGMWDWLARDTSLDDVRTATSVLRQMKSKLASEEWRHLLETIKRKSS
jgi:DNA-binding MarR family transcriptional regulator